MRKITSLTSFVSFIVTIVTSVILYIVPHGRVANWADWTFWGMTKDDWGATHTTVGTLFILALLLHVWLNWKPIMSYMKNRARETVVLTVPMIISLALTIFVFAGTLLGLPPMRQLVDFSAQIKDGAIETYGNPPYGHAEESSLKKFCGYLGFDLAEAMAALEKAGYTLDKGEESVI
jgi:magnesium-transporting ATPase (P-type)